MGTHARLLLAAVVCVSVLQLSRAAPLNDAASKSWVVSFSSDPQVVEETRPVEAEVQSVVEGVKNILRSSQVARTADLVDVVAVQDASGFLDIEKPVFTQDVKSSPSNGNVGATLTESVGVNDPQEEAGKISGPVDPGPVSVPKDGIVSSADSPAPEDPVAPTNPVADLSPSSTVIAGVPESALIESDSSNQLDSPSQDAVPMPVGVVEVPSPDKGVSPIITQDEPQVAASNSIEAQSQLPDSIENSVDSSAQVPKLQEEVKPTIVEEGIPSMGTTNPIDPGLTDQPKPNIESDDIQIASQSLPLLATEVGNDDASSVTPPEIQSSDQTHHVSGNAVAASDNNLEEQKPFISEPEQVSIPALGASDSLLIDDAASESELSSATLLIDKDKRPDAFDTPAPASALVPAPALPTANSDYAPHTSPDAEATTSSDFTPMVPEVSSTLIFQENSENASAETVGPVSEVTVTTPAISLQAITAMEDTTGSESSPDQTEPSVEVGDDMADIIEKIFGDTIKEYLSENPLKDSFPASTTPADFQSTDTVASISQEVQTEDVRFDVTESVSAEDVTQEVDEIKEMEVPNTTENSQLTSETLQAIRPEVENFNNEPGSNYATTNKNLGFTETQPDDSTSSKIKDDGTQEEQIITSSEELPVQAEAGSSSEKIQNSSESENISEEDNNAEEIEETANSSEEDTEESSNSSEEDIKESTNSSEEEKIEEPSNSSEEDKKESSNSSEENKESTINSEEDKANTKLDGGNSDISSVDIKPEENNEKVNSEDDNSASSSETSAEEFSEEVQPSLIESSPDSDQLVKPSDTDDIDLSVQPAAVSWLRVRSDVQLRFARTLLRAALVNPSSKAQEVRLVLTLPEAAYVTGLSLESEGRVYRAYVRQREEADAEYEDAADKGLTAAQLKHTTARDSSVLWLLVTVAARSSLTVNMTYEELLTRRRGQYQHAVNVDPGQDVNEVTVDVFVWESRNLSSLAVSASGKPLYSIDQRQIHQNGVQNYSSELLSIERTGPAVAHVRVVASRDQQIALWSPLGAGSSSTSGRPKTHPLPALTVCYDVDRSETASGDLLLMDGYFVHFFAPPEVPPLRKHAIFVLDTSGSMWGHKLRQLQVAMNRILDSLHPDDFFSIVQFASHVMEWSPHTLEVVGLRDKEASLPATRDHISKAKKFINTMEASGGTNIGGALRAAIRLAGKRDYDRWPTYRAGGADKPQPVIVFLTDGLPTVGTLSLGRVLALTRAANAEIKAAIFSLSFGSRSNWRFLQRLSLQNDGFARRIYEAGDASQQLQNFYQEISSPLLANVTFNYVTAKVDGATVTKRSFPLMFGGGEVIVAGRLADKSTRSLEAEVEMWGAAPGTSAAVGAAPGRQMLRATAVDIEGLKPPPIPDANPMKYNNTSTPSKPTVGLLERLWAYLNVKQLLNDDLIYDDIIEPGEPPKKEPDDDQPRQRALYLALKYGFVTRITSLVVVQPATNDSSKMAEVPVRPLTEYAEAERDGEGFPITNKLTEITISRPGPGTVPVNFQPLLFAQHENATVPLPLSAISWLAQHTDSSGRLRVGSSTFSLELPPAEEQQNLISAASAQCSGHTCRPLASCVQPAVASSFMVFRDYFCPLGTYAGICCSF